jgi:hypothetical protein
VKLIFRRTALLGVLFVSLLAAADENAPQLVARYEHLQLGSAPVTVGNLTITSGSMKFTLNSGSAATVKADDEVVGLFFAGDGAFDYNEEAVELPLAKSNLRFTKAAATLKDSLLHGNVKNLLIVTSKVPLPALEGAAAAADSLDAAFARNRSLYAADQESQLSMRFAAQKLTAPYERLFRAEFFGDDEWVFDGDQRDERLAHFYSVQFEDVARRTERYEAVISRRPVGRTRADIPPYDVMLSALDYTLTASDGHDLAVTATETLMPRTNGARGVALNLVDKLYLENPKPPRRYKVKSVTDESGAALPFVHSKGKLLVSLPQATMAASPIKLKFELEGDIVFRPSGDSYWVLREEWYPQPAQAGMATTAHGIVKVKNFVPFAGGKTISRKTEGEYNIIETQIDQPVDSVYVAAGKYFFEEEKRGNVLIRTASNGQKNARAIKQITALAGDMIAYYEYFLGPFPSDELDIIELNSYGFGQAPAGLVFITSEAFQPLLGDVNKFYSEGINERLAHEIAHQYWGTVVRMPSRDEEWLYESFAEYSAALLLKKFQGNAAYNRLMAHWKVAAQDALNVAPIPLANEIVEPSGDPWLRNGLLYNKGPYLLAALNKQVGDEAFMTFLKSYQKSFHNKLGTTKDVVGLLGFVTKQDFKPFFDKYYWGTALPDIK